jgi:tetratricopeptide (TPR) repeat protein
MSNSAKYWIIGIIVLAAVIGIIWALAEPGNPFPVEPADRLTNWQIPVTIDASSTAAFEGDIAILKGEIGTTSYSAADLYTAIGNGYLTLGEGREAYTYYGKALASATSTAPVIYDNLGALFERLYATSTAIKAYAKAVALAPATELYQLAYLEYLTKAAPAASSTAAAFAAAGEALGSTTPDYLIVRASWEGASGEAAAAIADWLAVRAQVAPAQRSAIDAQIARLRQQQ